MSQHAIDGRGADGALLHWQKLIRAHLVIADGEIRSGAYFQSRAITVAPWLAGMRDDLAFPLQLAIAQKRFFQDCSLVFQLGRIPRVLVMATTAGAKIRAWRRNPVWRRLEYLIDRGAAKLFFPE